MFPSDLHFLSTEMSVTFKAKNLLINQTAALDIYRPYTRKFISTCIRISLILEQSNTNER